MVDEIDVTGKRFIQMGLSGNPQATRWFERKGFDLFALKVSFLFFCCHLFYSGVTAVKAESRAS